MKSLLKRLLQDEEGQGLVEYVLIMALVVVVAIAAVSFFGQRNINMVNNASNKI